MRHTIHAGYQRYVDSEDLTRSSNGWGSITVPGGRPSASRGSRSSTWRRSSSRRTGARARPFTPSTSSQSLEFNDTIALARTGRSTSACSPATTRSTARGCKRIRRRCPATSLATDADGRQLQDVRDPVQQDAAAAAERDLGLQRQGHGLRELRDVQPGGELAAARGVVGPQSRRRRINAYFDANGVLFATDPLASSSGKLFVPDLTPRTIDEIADRHGAGSSAAHWSGRAYWPLPPAASTSGKTRTTPRAASALSTRRTCIPHDAVHPEPGPASRADRQRLAQIVSGSSYVIAELDGAFTRYTR